MSLKILDKPLSLHARAITIGLQAHRSEPGFPQHAVASFNHLKLIAYRKKQPRSAISLIWVIMDGFYLLSESYRSIIKLPDLQLIDYVFVVGDCGSLDHLRIAAKRPGLKLLLGSNKLASLIKRLKNADAFTRLSYQIPPALLYEAWDLVKDPRSKFPKVEENSSLFFAGNDGLKGIFDVFQATGSLRQLDCEPDLHPSSYQDTLQSSLNNNASLQALAAQGIEYFRRLALFTEAAIEKQSRHLEDISNPSRIQCLKTILFKSIFRKTILSWLDHNSLGLIITKPRVNRAYYAYRALNCASMLDMGGLNGFEDFYPRTLDCFLYDKSIFSINDDCRNILEAIQSCDNASCMNLFAILEAKLIRATQVTNSL